MPLSAGTRLGHFDITAPLGAGGMGEVYRARDAKLGRDVAIKTLPDALAQDAERLARFRREAQLLAALNHPHIAAIYGLEEIDGRHLLVLELVEGQTLASRLRQGSLPLDDALTIAREIVLAVEAAHEQGIVHRDLKPANIALAADNSVKVLDFGLARMAEPASAAHSGAPLDSPTITSPMTLTALGVILGTAAYMSPEQARGLVADKRSDVWAFGCVLYEMLTGARAFPGEDVTDTLAAVVRSQPDWSLLPAQVGPSVRALLEGCLQKDRRKRISDLSAARFVLERSGAFQADAPPSASKRRGWPTLLAAAAAGALVMAAAAYTLARPPAPATVTKFSIQVPAGSELGVARRSVAVSPDGGRIAYAAGGRIYIRSLSEFDAQPVPGTDAGLQPAFSPDGASLAFWSEGAIMRIPLAGGVATRIVDVSPAPYGLVWGPSGIIYVSPGSGIHRVSPHGGTGERIVSFRDTDGFTQGPDLLPDGDTMLFTLTGMSGQTNIWDTGRIVRQSLRTGDRTVLIEGGSNATYVPTGHLLYTVEGILMAAPYDLERGTVTAPGVPVVEGVRRASPAAGAEGQFSVSPTGTLVYLPGPPRAGDETVFVYRKDGTFEQLKLPKGTFAYPRVSPDGKWVAMGSQEGREWQVVIYDLSGKAALRRLTFGGNNQYPQWSSERSLIFQSDREGDHGLFRQALDGGKAERLTTAEPGTSHVPESWSAAHDVLLYSIQKGTSYELRALSMRGRASVPFGDVTSINFPPDAMFSPDGRWVAYQAGQGQTGEATVYVEPYPPNGTKYQIGRGGRPIWSPAGDQLFFIPGPGVFLATTVTSGSGTFAFTTPQSVPRLFGLAPPANPRTVDFLPDGRMVGINTSVGAGGSAPRQINIVENWFAELRAKVPVR